MSIDLAFILKDCGGDVAAAQRRIDRANAKRDAEIGRLREGARQLVEHFEREHARLEEAIKIGQELDADNARLREVLEFYADKRSYQFLAAYDSIPVVIDQYGGKARAALAGGTDAAKP